MKKYLVDLTGDERTALQAVVRRGKTSARKVTRARILLHAAKGATDAEIVSAVGVGVATVERARRRFVEEGLGALDERPRPGARPRLSEKAEARLVAEACSQAPEGREHWTMRLLAGRVVELGLADSCSHETVRRALKKKRLKPWLKKQWCIPSVSSEYVACMEDVLDLYAERGGEPLRLL